MSPRWFPDNEIRIEASPAAIVIRDSVQQITLPTTVWVTSDGKKSFDPILSGFQRKIFEASALQAGAREVRFDDAEGVASDDVGQ